MVCDDRDHAKDVGIIEKEKEMSLIDRYIAEVGRHLPEQQRADIEAEIRSNLEDVIEENSQQTGTPMDDSNISVALEQLGDPALLAHKYSPAKRYLIGPQWYEAYVETLKRILYTALPVFAIVTFMVHIARVPTDVMNAFGEAFGGAVSVGIQILFWVTLVFVLLDRSDVQPDEQSKSKPGAWTVAKLPAMPKKRQISIGEVLANIVFVVIGLGWIGLPLFFAQFQGVRGFVSVFHPNLWNIWLPLFFVLAGLTLIHEWFKLRIGNWTPALTVTNLILGIAAIVYIIALVTTQEIFNPAFLATLTEGVGAEELPTITSWAKWTVNISAIIIIGIYIWEMLDSVFKSRRLVK